MENFSPDIVEALGLCRFGERRLSIGRDLGNKPRHNKTNKITKKNTLNYFVTLGLQNKVRSLEQEMRTNAAREGEVYSGTRWVEIMGKWGDH